ncbi:hypothetical protein NK280_23600, partial [Salmonella enterica]|nr:hypothetical protein [Salmonella enterica]
VIENPTLAGRIESAFGTSVPQNAYEVRLSDNGSLYWLERRGNDTIRHDTEPNTSWLERVWIRGLSWLPIDWML